MSRSLFGALALVCMLLAAGQARAAAITPPEGSADEFTTPAGLLASSEGSTSPATYCAHVFQSISFGPPCSDYTANTGVAAGFTSPWLNEPSFADPGYKLTAFASPSNEDQVTTLPEPSTYVLMAAGLLGMGFIARNRTTHRER